MYKNVKLLLFVLALTPISLALASRMSIICLGLALMALASVLDALALAYKLQGQIQGQWKTVRDYKVSLVSW